MTLYLDNLAIDDKLLAKAADDVESPMLATYVFRSAALRNRPRIGYHFARLCFHSATQPTPRKEERRWR